MLLADWELKQTPMIASISVGYDSIVLFALRVSFGPVDARSSSALFADLEMDLATDLASFMLTLIFSQAAFPSSDSMALLKSATSNLPMNQPMAIPPLENISLGVVGAWGEPLSPVGVAAGVDKVGFRLLSLSDDGTTRILSLEVLPWSLGDTTFSLSS
jgi:hypothetical protein